MGKVNQIQSIIRDRKDEFVEYIINKNNIGNLTSLMKVFGMASNRHHHDVIEIIKILIDLIGY